MSLPELRCLLCDRVLLDENSALPSERCLQCGKLMQLGMPEHPSVPPGEQAGVTPGEGSLLTTAFDELPEAIPVVQPRKAPPVLQPSNTIPEREIPVVQRRSEPPVVRPAPPPLPAQKPKWEPPIQMHPPTPPRDEEIERPKPKYGCALLVMFSFALLALLAVTFIIYAIARGLKKVPKAEATSPKLVVEATTPKPEKPNVPAPEVAAAPLQSLWIPPRGTFPLGTATASVNATLPLPGACTHGVQAGNGRFVLFPVPTAKMVVLFDVATASIAGYLPMPQPDSLVAGSANHAFIVSPLQRTISRFDLVTLKLEMASFFPDRIGRTLAVAAGPASRGPVYLLAASKVEPALHLVHPETLALIDWKANPIPFKKPNGVFTEGVPGTKAYLRTSASGRIVYGGASRGQQNYRVDSLELVGLEPAIAPTGISIAAPAFPTADGSMAAFATDPKPGVTRFPMAEGNGYFEIADKGGSNVLTMTFPGDSKVQRAEVKGIEDFADDTGSDRDRRAFLIPGAHALVYLGADGLSIRWRRVRVSSELAKLSQEYLVVQTTPPATAQRAQTYTYEPKALSNFGDADAGYKLDTAPPGMKVENRRVVWDVPADFPLGDVSVELSVESKLKPNIGAKQRFPIAVVSSAEKTANLFAPKLPQPRGVRSVMAGDPGTPLQFGAPANSSAKRGAAYRVPIPFASSEDADIVIASGPPGMSWKGADLSWDVPADFPLEPQPIVLVTVFKTGRSISLGYLLDVQE